MKTAVVTGAGGGMGTRLVETLELQGINCILIEHDKDYLEEFIHKLDGRKHMFIKVDLTDERKVLEAVNKISKKFNKIDYLFNLAGIGIYKTIENLSISEWRDSIDVNLSAPFIFSKTLLPLLKKSDDPLVLSWGSGMGIYPHEKRVAYCATKFGLRGMSLTLSKEFKDEKVDFVLLTLGSVMTGFGTGGLKKRKELEKKGKNYLEVGEVMDKVLEIINEKKRKDEYTLYPSGYESESKM